jgi:hypothetical protein
MFPRVHVSDCRHFLPKIFRTAYVTENPVTFIASLQRANLARSSLGHYMRLTKRTAVCMTFESKV